MAWLRASNDVMREPLRMRRRSAMLNADVFTLDPERTDNPPCFRRQQMMACRWRVLNWHDAAASMMTELGIRRVTPALTNSLHAIRTAAGQTALGRGGSKRIRSPLPTTASSELAL